MPAGLQVPPGGTGNLDPNDPGSRGLVQDPQTGLWMRPNAPAPVGPGGWSNWSNQNYGNGGEGQNTSGQPNSTGKVRSPGAWGGYTGNALDDGHGGTYFDPTHSGRQDAVDHLNGLGAAAAGQQAYQNDYGQANQFAQLGNDARQDQVGASYLAGQSARGENLQSEKLGNAMLQQGVQAQQAGAASTRGGSLAAAAAMRQQAQGQGAFQMQGQQQIAAQRAADMAAGRDTYAAQSANLRAGDAQAQGLDANQAIQQMNNEMKQRQLNQAGELGYAGLAQNTNIGAAQASLNQQNANDGLAAVSIDRNQAKLDQGVGYVGDTVQAVGTILGGASAAGSPTPPPTSSTSDERAKTNVRGLGYAAMARKGMR